jgi:urease accessory protein UreH
MGKKRKVLSSWCWYCDRSFDDDKVLVNHQKAKHFKCAVCDKQHPNIGQLVYHAKKVHQQEIDKVRAACPHESSGCSSRSPCDTCARYLTHDLDMIAWQSA